MSQGFRAYQGGRGKKKTLAETILQGFPREKTLGKELPKGFEERKPFPKQLGRGFPRGKPLSKQFTKGFRSAEAPTSHLPRPQQTIEVMWVLLNRFSAYNPLEVSCDASTASTRLGRDARVAALLPAC
jgi:hypothetical protein